MATHVQCTPEELNDAKNPAEAQLKSQPSAPVMKEDRNADPIKADVYSCALNPFMAGSYNVSLYMANEKRTGGKMNSGDHIAGLATVYDYDGYYEASLLSRDSKGTLHMVQYYPRIDSIAPAAGSTEGGTVVTIEGGGFPMDDSFASVQVAGRKCVVTYASIERIVCNTTAQVNATIPGKVAAEIDHDAAGVPDVAMVSAQLVGNWSRVSDSKASGESGASYLLWAEQQQRAAAASASSVGAAAAEADVAWASFSPPGEAVNVSGVYELLLTVPTSIEHRNVFPSWCARLSKNVSVVVRSGHGYSLATVDLAAAAGASSAGLALVGSFAILSGASTLATVDASGAGACVAVGGALLRFKGPISAGCTDPLAANYDAQVAEDDGSCVFVGGRGLTTQSWSAMNPQYKLDDWYPKEEFQTWSSGGYCHPEKAADAFPASATSLEPCLRGDCPLHQQCGEAAFCCVSALHSGCTPTSLAAQDVDPEGFKLIFRHDMARAGPWKKGVWRSANATTDPERDAFSLLTELEDYRRPDGRFEFKACWPKSGFKRCQVRIEDNKYEILFDVGNPKSAFSLTALDSAPEPDDESFKHEQFRHVRRLPILNQCQPGRRLRVQRPAVQR